MDSTKVDSQEIEIPDETRELVKKQKYDDVQRQMSLKFEKGPADHPVHGYILEEEDKFGR